MYAFGIELKLSQYFSQIHIIIVQVIGGHIKSIQM